MRRLGIRAERAARAALLLDSANPLAHAVVALRLLCGLLRAPCLVAVSLALAPFGKLFVFSLDCSSAGGRRSRILLWSGLRATSSGAEIGKEFFCFSSPLSFICFLSNSLSRLLLCSSRMFRVLSWTFSFVCEVSPSSCSFSSVALLQAWLCADLHRGLCAIHGTLYITSRLASSPLSHGCVYASLFMQFQVIGGGPLLWKETTDIEASVKTGSSWPRAASSRSIPSVCRDALSSFVQKSEAFCMA